MAEPAEVEETPEEEKWLERHPKTRVLLLVGKMLFVPIVVGLMGTWVEVRTAANKERVEAGWNTMAPAVKDLQNQVTQLSNQLDLMRKLVLAQPSAVAPAPVAEAPKPAPTLRPLHRPTPSPSESPEVVMRRRLEQEKLLERLKSMQAPVMQEQRRIPDKLDDVLKMAK